MAATADFGRILLNQTGTRLIDWIDYFTVPMDEDLVGELQNMNFQLTMEN